MLNKSQSLCDCRKVDGNSFLKIVKDKLWQGPFFSIGKSANPSGLLMG